MGQSRENLLLEAGPSSANPMSRSRSLVRRQKSLIKPERSRSRKRTSFARENFLKDDEQEPPKKSFGCWNLTTLLCTCCCCACLLEKCGMSAKPVQEAWREKVTLCLIILTFCAALGFLTFGFTTVVCQEKGVLIKFSTVKEKNNADERWFIIHGQIYNFPSKYGTYDHAKSSESGNPLDLYATTDISVYFPDTPTCKSIGENYVFQCKAPGTTLTFCHSPNLIQPQADGNNGFDMVGTVAYDWSDIDNTKKMVYNGKVLDLSFYFDQIAAEAESKPFGDEIDAIFRRHAGQDATKALSSLDPLLRQCLFEWFFAGNLQVKNIGCIATDIVLYISLVVILSVVMIKFFLAAFYGWYIRYKIRKLDKEKKNEVGRKKKNSNEMLNTPILASSASSSKFSTRFATALSRKSEEALNVSYEKSDKMYTILLVTCYSEGEAGLRTTLESLAEMDYDDSQKLLVVIADGIIRGSGNEKSTPDILLDLIEKDESQPVSPFSYVAIADGTKRHNMARVHAGHYQSKNHRVPIILIIKCGTPQEASNPKPGNRGKRDSQIILMSFFNKVLFDDRMTPLEYDIFRKIEHLTQVTADKFELILMVDADTNVMPSALSAMVTIMKDDENIMGMCGETKIANKTTSWVSMIQVSFSF